MNFADSNRGFSTTATPLMSFTELVTRFNGQSLALELAAELLGEWASRFLVVLDSMLGSFSPTCALSPLLKLNEGSIDLRPAKKTSSTK